MKLYSILYSDISLTYQSTQEEPTLLNIQIGAERLSSTVPLSHLSLSRTPTPHGRMIHPPNSELHSLGRASPAGELWLLLGCWPCLKKPCYTSLAPKTLCTPLDILWESHLDQPLSCMSVPCWILRNQTMKAVSAPLAQVDLGTPTGFLLDVTQSPQGLADPSGNLNRPYLRCCHCAAGDAARPIWDGDPEAELLDLPNFPVAASKIIVKHQEWVASKIQWFIITLPIKFATNWDAIYIYMYIYAYIYMHIYIYI